MDYFIIIQNDNEDILGIATDYDEALALFNSFKQQRSLYVYKSDKHGVIISCQKIF
jgi:hypothetical protein